MFEDKQILILNILDQFHPRELYGLEIVRNSNGKIGRGSVYAYLSMMENDGLVASRPEEGELPQHQPRRRLYRLTDKGSRARMEARSSPETDWGGLTTAS